MSIKSIQVCAALRDAKDLSVCQHGGRLSWYAMSEGWFDLVLGGETRLFELESGDPRGVEWYTARFWEDLLSLEYRVLEGLPSPLLERLHDLTAWHRWVEETLDVVESHGLWQEALGWWSDLQLDTGFLRGAPLPCFLPIGDSIRVTWDSVPDPDAPRWTSPRGSALVSVSDFTSEIGAFDERMVEQMRLRVNGALAEAKDWEARGVVVDRESLQYDLDERERWRRDLPRRMPKRDWKAVLNAVEELERRIGRVRPSG